MPGRSSRKRCWQPGQCLNMAAPLNRATLSRLPLAATTPLGDSDGLLAGKDAPSRSAALSSAVAEGGQVEEVVRTRGDPLPGGCPVWVAVAPAGVGSGARGGPLPHGFP